MKRPNVILLYTDQQRCDSLKCYGSPWGYSPHIDRLASEGVLLRNYHVNSPICAPSRMSFLTGQYCSALGVGGDGYEFPARTTIPLHQLLKAEGYQTAQIGKLHFQPHSNRDHRQPPKDYGFDHYIVSDEPGCYDDAYIDWVRERAPEQVQGCRTALPPAAVALGMHPKYTDLPGNVHQPYVFGADEPLTHSSFVTERTCAFLREAKNQVEPFFVIAGYYAPHAPLNPPGRFLDLFDLEAMRLPVLAPQEEMADFLKHLTDTDWKRIAQHYYALCAHVDDCIGKVLSLIDELGMRDDTIVVFTSDHGEYLGDHGRIQKGMPAEDCISNVPFIVRYPGVASRGRACDALAEGVDFAATVLEWCGVQQPSFVQGRSLVPVLTGATGIHRDSVLIEFFESDGSAETATVKTKDFTYYADALSGSEKLFDRKSDPDENTDQSRNPEYAGALSEMRYRMSQRLQHARCRRVPKVAEY